jgi:hypothetical protein
MKLKVGQSLASVTDTTGVVVIRAPSDDVELTCGKVAMVDPKSDAAKERQPLASTDPEGTLLGKRYVDDDNVIEVLCTKAGPARLEMDGKQLSVKAAKPLPASD